jgi:hypothetical protein
VAPVSGSVSPSFPPAIRRREAVRRLRDAIVARLGEPASGASRGGPQCVGEEEARVFVRRELDSQGYRDWTVKIAGGTFTGDRPCADVCFDGAGKAVILVAVGSRG